MTNLDAKIGDIVVFWTRSYPHAQTFGLLTAVKNSVCTIKVLNSVTHSQQYAHPRWVNVSKATESQIADLEKSHGLIWTRISAGHYDSWNGKYRIDSCSDNKTRFEVSVLFDRGKFEEPSWEMICCCASLYEAKQYANDEFQQTLKEQA